MGATHSLIEFLYSTAHRPLARESQHTPLVRHDALSRDFGVDFLVKREDRLDDLGCGHKLRKLSYVVADALKQKATVTVGSVPSNQCKAVAVMARKYGLRAHVIYTGDRQRRPTSAQGNYFLTSLLEPDIRWFEDGGWCRADEYLQSVLEREYSRGEQPYVIASGASAWPGLLGSIELGAEIANQASKLNRHKLEVVLPAGSGGTCLGIQLAAERLGLDWRIHGICIGEPAATQRSRVASFRGDVASHLGWPLRGSESLQFYDCAIGAGYDSPRREELKVMADSLRLYNLVLDPNYMLKCFIGAAALIAEGVISRGSRTVLVHTAGQVGLFDGNPLVSEWHKQEFKAWLRD